MDLIDIIEKILIQKQNINGQIIDITEIEAEEIFCALFKLKCLLNSPIK